MQSEFFCFFKKKWWILSKWSKSEALKLYNRGYHMNYKYLGTIALLLIAPLSIIANIGPKGFHAYNYNRVFVETGTFKGEGIQNALKAGFQEIHSLELNKTSIKNSRARFKKKKNIHIYKKDSSFQLWEVISSINEPITFWLDAHNGFPDPSALDQKNTPLLKELDQIKRHPIKSHTILIDDLHCCNTLLFDFISLDEIIAKVLEINPDYFITFIEGGNKGEYLNNILVALPPEYSRF